MKFTTQEVLNDCQFWQFLKREETVAVSKLRASLDPGGTPKIPVLFRMADTLMWFPVVFDRMQDMQGQCMWETEVPGLHKGTSTGVCLKIGSLQTASLDVSGDKNASHFYGLGKV